jgi:hypothetical protein
VAYCWFIKCASKVGRKWPVVGSSSGIARLVASVNWVDNQVCYQGWDKVLSGSFIKCASQVRRKWHADGSKSVLARLMVTVSSNWLDNQVC